MIPTRSCGGKRISSVEAANVAIHEFGQGDSMVAVKRIFSLKLVRFKSGRAKGFVKPRLEDLVNQLYKVATTVGERHVPVPPPPPNKLASGMHCLCLNWRKVRAGKDGVMVEVVSYVNGVAPEQTTPDFAAPSLPIKAIPLTDPATGKTSEVVHAYRVLFFGDCALIEMEKGGGGVATLALALTALFRAHVNPALPAIEFMDVVGADLKKSIAAAGGIKHISASLNTPAKDAKKQPLGYRLTQLKKWAGKNASVSAEIEFIDGDNIQKGIKALDEFAAGESLNSVVLYLRDGQKITGVGKYVEKRRLDINLTPSNSLNILEVQAALWNYLDEVRTPDKTGWRLVDSNGIALGAVPIDGKKNP
ncbi:hypothetical protein [Stenotrophomonas maltophilia]|uniref:hypothetical protein n=1 Tax=Stenotrophomonas maltophilia TaxID=40324 RepID=UPI00117E8397|nr:hypothetical protein [Stenotrophomonas maltophilia]